MIQTVREVAQQVMDDARYVKIDANNISNTAKLIKELPKSSLEVPKPDWFQLGQAGYGPMIDNYLVQYEVIAGSVNYCYWYGKSNIRPQGASSTKMYQLLDETITPEIGIFFNDGFIDKFYRKMVDARFPLLVERYMHLQELIKTREHIAEVERNVLKEKDVNATIECLARNYPGFGSDIFLNRAQLFVMQIQKHLNVFDDDQIKQLTVPVGCQIPKILRNFGCIWYDHLLRLDVNNEKFIPKGSLREIEIRAATIVVCDMIAEQSGTNTMVVDNFLWQFRKEIDIPFHLTVTTDY